MTGFFIFFHQEDKEPLFDTIDTIKGVLQVATGTLSTLTVWMDGYLMQFSDKQKLPRGYVLLN